jgi:hypothetical protein
MIIGWFLTKLTILMWIEIKDGFLVSFSTIFQVYCGVSFIGGKQSTLRKKY